MWHLFIVQDDVCKKCLILQNLIYYRYCSHRVKNSCRINMVDYINMTFQVRYARMSKKFRIN